MQAEHLKEIIPHITDNIPLSIHHTDSPSNTAIPLYLHWHDELEFLIVTKGSAIFHIENRSYHVKTGQAIFVNSNSLHYATSYQNEPCSFSAVVFDTSMISPTDYHHIFVQFINPVLNHSILFQEFFSPDELWQNDLIIHIQKLLKCEGKIKDHELLITSLLLYIWQILYDHREDNKIAQKNINERHLTLLKQNIEYMHNHFNENLSLEELAKEISISPSYYSHIFKEIFHCSPIDYLLHYRLHQASKLLLTTDNTITDIASNCGFNNISYFNRKFLDEYGCNPKRYRMGDGGRFH